MGTAVEIADGLVPLIKDPTYRLRIGAAGREFARRELSWEQSAQKIHRLYDDVLHARSARPITSRPAGDNVNTSLISTPSIKLVDSDVLLRIERQYRGCYCPPALGYGTVRDFCDSVDTMPRLASANRDLKDCQRPWALKAILGVVPKGGKLLEIGAGEPIVADLLRRLGYEVWIVDPYDGSGNGPQDYEIFRRQYPHLHFVREAFSATIAGPSAAYFDCIYSISVLEHVPVDSLDLISTGNDRFLRPGGSLIHAIDHVVKGRGAEEHLAKLTRLVRSFGFAANDLNAMLQQMADDVDCYHLSAESHNMWRGSKSYDEFPMRDCVSVNLCAPAPLKVASG
jgi:2-polyprenyl-3-methyl-5-hydroxy-6-metoxy-1,4-benzoquinol methylase